MNRRSVLYVAGGLAAAGAGGLSIASTASAAPSDSVKLKPLDTVIPDSVEKLSLDTQRAQSLRDVKNLQYSFAEFGQYGLWEDMADLFAADAEYHDGDKVVTGRKNVKRHLLTAFGSGRAGLAVGELRNQMFYAPVVTLSVDGLSATGRWTELTMTGRLHHEANWSGGVQVNDYVKEEGTWRISRMRRHPQFSGSYETGFFTPGPETPTIPFHFSPGLAGRPVPEMSSDVDKSADPLSLARIEQQVRRMNDESEVRNLQHVYGYYQDRKMWDDVVDLFTDDGVLEIVGTGVYRDGASIRRCLERDGSAGLQRGQVNDQIQLHTMVEVDPDGRRARARGLQLGMLSPRLGKAYWMVSTFLTQYVKQDGTWRISQMQVYPKMKADYYRGWHRSSVVDSAPTGAAAPDRPSPQSNSPQTHAVIPAFFANPATGKPVTYPDHYRVVGDHRRPKTGTAPSATGSGSEQDRLAAARRQLEVAKAYDAIENVSSAFGYYLDDFRWDELVAVMADDGTRPQGKGFYVGREHVYRAMSEAHIAPWSPSNPMDGIRVHLRLQPVIDIAADGGQARIRSRMFLYYANSEKAGAWNSGMYPNDTAVLEDGVWKMRVAGVIDETYFNSSSYENGWAKPTTQQPGTGDGASRNGSPISFPPDIPWSYYDDFRRKDWDTIKWPDIKPMWFAYRNPVSGRLPEHYCPDILKA
ncbi:nuclear transport factor 2 family protein [Streptomyces sp. MnatMP-M27]|uniref:nuclear transport factor 2 family protein n=1 Tax=Streptomyces sp. MnatMP-M27 TaxID=1839768 RepID=UPI00159F2E47|nr:nuclear transport factor 2 family protein [Streptomyces sp. MnatMP-M27]